MIFAGQRMIVFGGARGLGKGIAQHLAGLGASVTVTSRRLDAAEAVANSLPRANFENTGQAHTAFSVDVRDREAVHAVCRSVLEEPGSVLGAVVNSAGLAHNALSVRATEADAREMAETNFLGALNVAVAAGDAMLRQRRGGAVIHIGSAAANRATVGNSVYAATKAGVHALARGMALELATRQIRFNVVAPGYAATDMTADLDHGVLAKSIPLGRLAEVSDVAQAVEYMISAKYVTGQVLVVDGGLTL